MVEQSSSPVSIVPEDSAWGYLASAEVGRLAVVEDGTPEIFPVNFCLDGESVVFRSAEGSKLNQLVHHDQVAFEADGWGEDGGWSVLVKGTASIITEEDELARAQKFPLLPWVPTVKNIFIRITPTEEISARTFAFGAEPAAN